MRAASPSLSTQPQWSTSATQSPRTTTATNINSKTPTKTNVREENKQSLVDNDTAIVNDVGVKSNAARNSIDLSALAQPGVDVRRWINATLGQLQRSAEAEKPNETSHNETTTSSTLKETSVTELITNALYDRVQQHAHEVGSEVEELIAQTIVRLPRTTLELNRMRADTKDVAAQLSAIEAAVKVEHQSTNEENKKNVSNEEEEDSAVQAGRLNALKQAQAKLQRCSATLDRAMRVDAKLHAIEEATQRLRRGQDAMADEPIDAIAAAVRAVQADLAALREVESNYGERQRTTLRRCEEVIEGALERQCLSYFMLHHIEQAAKLFHILHSIGRAEAVLQNYASHVMEDTTQRISRGLRRMRPAGTDVAVEDTGNTTTTTTSISQQKTVAELLWRDIVPLVSKTLSEELGFLCGLITHIQHESTTLDTSESVRRKKTSEETTNNSKDGVESALSMEEMVRQALQNMIARLAESFTQGMKPLMQEDASKENDIECNRAWVDWYDAIRHIRVQSNGSSDSHESKVMAVQLTAYAIDQFARVFHDSATLEAFCTRAVRDIEAHVTACLPTNTGSSNVSLSLSDPYSALSQALLARVKEVVRYFPRETLSRCVTGWHAALQRLIDPLRPPETQNNNTNNSKTNLSQAELLRRLFIVTRRVRSGLLRCQKPIDAFLSANHPSNTNITNSNTVDMEVVENDEWAEDKVAKEVQATLHEQLWLPLYSDIESVAEATQEAIKAAMLRPLYAKTATYTSLPYWHTTSSTTGSGNTAEVTLGSPLAPYNAGHSAPSQPVREVGEAIIEIPLLLDTLRVESGAAADSTTNTTSQSFLCIPREEMNALIEEMAESWLETIVHGVIEDFVQEKVLRLRIDFAAVQPPEEALRRIAGALEQVDTDLSYLKNILSAVSEERVRLLEEVLMAVHTLPARSDSAAFVLGDILHLA